MSMSCPFVIAVLSNSFYCSSSFYHYRQTCYDYIMTLYRGTWFGLVYPVPFFTIITYLSNIWLKLLYTEMLFFHCFPESVSLYCNHAKKWDDFFLSDNCTVRSKVEKCINLIESEHSNTNYKLVYLTIRCSVMACYNLLNNSLCSTCTRIFIKESMGARKEKKNQWSRSVGFLNYEMMWWYAWYFAFRCN